MPCVFSEGMVCGIPKGVSCGDPEGVVKGLFYEEGTPTKFSLIKEDPTMVVVWCHLCINGERQVHLLIMGEVLEASRVMRSHGVPYGVE